MKHYLFKGILILITWAVAYGVIYVIGLAFGREEVSNWGFYIAVGFAVSFGPKYADYLIRKYKKAA